MVFGYFNVTFPRKSGHMIKFHEGAFHTALGSCTLMPNDSSDPMRYAFRQQTCFVPQERTCFALLPLR
jgi:hypothetical protein